jgi:hypothetical protein
MTAIQQSLDAAIENKAINTTSALQLNQFMERHLLPVADLDLIKDMSVSERIDLLGDLASSAL